MTKVRTPNYGERLDILIGLPNLGSVMTQTALSLMRMYHDFALWRPEGVRRKRIATVAPSTSMLVKSRHDIVLQAIKRDCTHVLFVDSDMQFPADTLQWLLAHGKDFVAVNATTRGFPVQHIAHDLQGKRVDSRKKYGLQKVQHVGLAVALVKVDVFKRMEPPLFMMEWIPGERTYCGEDVYFCVKAQAAGVDIYIDHDLSHEVFHIGRQAFGPGLIGHELPELKV